MAQEPQLNKLCEECQNFTSDPLTWPTKWWRGPCFAFHDINGLIRSAKEGCHICNLIVAELPESKLSLMQRELELNPQHSLKQLFVWVDVHSKRDRGDRILCRIDLMHSSLSLHPGLPYCLIPIVIADMRGTEVGHGAIDTDSHETMEMIKGWIEKCVDGHPGCASVQTTGRLPTRLLHIEKAGDSLKIRLCLSTTLSPSTPYATLSHIWGSGSPMRLASDNVLQYQQDIPLARLPQTFIDAIKLTDALGLSYLWIDSLCIVQDLTLDWEMESTTMCDVYRGSTVNIAASASVNCDGGLFRQRNPLSVTPCILDLSYKQKSGARLGEGGPYALMCEIACDRDPLVNDPLSRQAWTVQERILAPRTVYFTARKIYFLCCKKITSEVDPCSFNEYNGFNEDVVKTWTMSHPTLTPPFFELDFCSEQWKRVVQQYTHGQLSLESDKLVAIAGLAKYMQKAWPFPNTTYLAGLWSAELLDWLMWRRSRTLVTLTRPKAYRAPSWSRAFVEGEVEWNSDRRRVGSSDLIHRASIVEARTSPTGDPYGIVYGGCIQIRGRLCITTRAHAKSQPVWDVVSVTGRHDPEHIPEVGRVHGAHTFHNKGKLRASHTGSAN